MKANKTKFTRWYIEPIGSHTNSILSGNLPAEDACRDQLCSDGKRRNLWRCTHIYVTRFQEEKEKLGLRFRVFVQTGQYGKIRKWLFEIPKARALKKVETVPF